MGTTRRQAPAWNSDTVATAGALLPRATSRSAADTARSGGRCIVCTTGTDSPAPRAEPGTTECVRVYLSRRADAQRSHDKSSPEVWNAES